MSESDGHRTKKVFKNGPPKVFRPNTIDRTRNLGAEDRLNEIFFLNETIAHQLFSTHRQQTNKNFYSGGKNFVPKIIFDEQTRRRCQLGWGLT